MPRSPRLLKPFLAALVAASALLTGVALAQDASGEVQVLLSKGDLVHVTKVDDWTIALGPDDNTINFWQYEWDFLCVYSATGRFRVSVSGSHSSTDFQALSSDNTPMRYEVWSFSRANVNFGAPVRHTAPFTLDNRRGSTSLTCADEGYQNSNLFFAPLVRATQYNPAPPGIYRDTVTITVSAV